MTKRQSGQARSRKVAPREWVLRGALASLALVLGYVSTTQTFAVAISKANPERAHRVDPSDGRIAAQLAQRLSVNEADASERPRANMLAHRALSDEPLAAPAVTVLGLAAQLKGDSAAARRLFDHSDRLSRRELPARLWMIEDAVQRNDVPGAIRNYDIALRTSREAPELLFPILSEAIADPVIAHTLVSIYARQPPWGDTFLYYLSGQKSNPRTSAAFLEMLGTRGIAVPDVAKAGVVNALVAKGAFDEAWSYYRTFRAGVDRRRSRDPNFLAEFKAPTEFDWIPVMNDTGITATIQRTAQGGVFDFAAPSTIGGIVLQQLQWLPQGQYRLEGRSSGLAVSQTDLPYWILTCSDGREIGRINLPNSSEQNGNFVGDFKVDANCRSQMLRLVMRPATDMQGVSGQVSRVILHPVKENR